MKKFLAAVIILTSSAAFAQPKFSSISSMPGAFSRMGFGARGMGMGNAMSAVTEGNLVSYYNPALAFYQKNNSFQASYSILSLDRSLNFINYTKSFINRGAGNEGYNEGAGISLGIINSGVGNIDGRDNSGNKTGDFSTSENQFFIAFAKSFSSKLTLGLSVKFFYYKLYEQVSSTGVGVDFGALYSLSRYFNLSLVILDLNSKYKWDTSPIYQDNGSTSEDKFPVLKRIGLSYQNPEYNIIASVEFENSNAQTNIIRAGLEYNIYGGLYLRGGIDQWNLSNSDYPTNPSLGFSYYHKVGGLDVGVDYAFVVEPYSPEDRHVVGLNVVF